MTNQEKDLKNAREYLDVVQLICIPECLVETVLTDEIIELDKMLSKYVQWLEQKGVIKFNENRFKDE